MRTDILNLTGKDIEGYELYTQVQLYIGTSGNNYFVADQVFVKYGINNKGKEVITDILVLENKLNGGTKLSNMQGSGYTNRTGTFRIRSKKIKSKYDKTKTLVQGGETEVELTFIKVYDGTDANTIDGIRFVDIQDL